MARLSPLILDDLRRRFRTLETRKATYTLLFWLGLLWYLMPKLAQETARAGQVLLIGETRRADNLAFYWIIACIALPFLLKHPTHFFRARTARFNFSSGQKALFAVWNLLLNPFVVLFVILTWNLLPLIGFTPSGRMVTAMLAALLLILQSVVTHGLIQSIQIPKTRIASILLGAGYGVTVWAWINRGGAEMLLPSGGWNLDQPSSFALPFLMLLVFLAPTLWLYTQSFGVEQTATARNTSRSSPPFFKHNPLQRLFFRPILHSMETWVALLAASGCALYQINHEDAPMEAAFFAVAVIAGFHALAAANLFGFDGPGFRRIGLWPLSGEDHLRKRNRTWAAAGLITLAPLLAAVLYRHGLLAALTCLLIGMLLTLLLVIPCNHASMEQARPRGVALQLEPGRPLASLLMALLIATMLISTIMLYRASPWNPVLFAVLLILPLHLWTRRQIRAQGQALDDAQAEIAERLLDR